jgi:hypothetical protein
MNQNRVSAKPIDSIKRSLRQHLSLKEELRLASTPALTILFVMAFVEVLSRQRLLFASLASSAFLVYLDPYHSSNAAQFSSGAGPRALDPGSFENMLLRTSSSFPRVTLSIEPRWTVASRHKRDQDSSGA